MSGSPRLRKLISRHFNISNAEADLLIGGGRVEVDGKKLPPAAKLFGHEEVRVDGKIIREGKKFSYVKFYKPRGIECTLNETIPENLLTAFHYPKKLFPVGRLDKESEGLLLMTDDGQFFKETAWSDKEKEKEYAVSVDKPVTAEFLQRMGEGVVIMGKRTRPAKIVQTGEFSFRIILTQGLNRQIRRMCYKLGYKVEQLIRLRIDWIELGNLQPGECEEISLDGGR